jgi:ESF2/ABP1 family protein
MAPEKRNHFLDAEESDEDVGQDYNSEDDLQKGGRSAKRRRVENDSDDDAQSDAGYDSVDEENDGSRPEATDEQQQRDGPKDEIKKEPKDSKKHTDLPNVSKPLTKKNLVATEAAIKKSGVVYLSRIPPFMKPVKLRSLLEPYGKINRIFLSPEDPSAHTRRVKAVCELLNAQTIGGKKGSFYRDDIWNLLYLKGFKWHNLTEQIAGENAERTSRMRAEISKTTKENKEFVRNVERAKMLNGIDAKNAAKKERKQQSTVDVEDVDGAGKSAEHPGKERKRTFAQIPLAKKKTAGEAQPDQVKRVLSSIF